MEDGIEDVESAAALVLALPLVAAMSIVGPALIVGSAILFVDGTVANYQNDLMMMILVSALSLLALGASLRAFVRAWKGGSSVTIFHRYLTLILPVLWLVGVALGYWGSTDIIEKQNRRASEHAMYACTDLMEKSDTRWEKCLVAVALCDEEANRCKKIGSEEQGRECTEEFERRLAGLTKSDRSKIEEPNGSYEKGLNKICLFERINE